MSDKLIHAHSASVSVCEGGKLVGVTFFDPDNAIIAHCHFDAAIAIDFAEDLGEAIGTVIAAMADGIPN